MTAILRCAWWLAEVQLSKQQKEKLILCLTDCENWHFTHELNFLNLLNWM